MPSSAAQSNARLIAGAMSGTSADGVDVALVRIEGRGLEMTARLRHHHARPYDHSLREAIFALRSSGQTTLADMARLGREISLAYADAVNAALAELAESGLAAADLAAVAAHGQTLYHVPPDTLQWLDPSLIAARVGCPVVSDFRRADCAAGGQGAPLVPFADYILFRDPRRHRVLLNIGGIANVTLLPAGGSPGDLIAFDTGPGNCICDYLMRQLDPAGPGVDLGGSRASRGKKAIARLCESFESGAFFSASPPKSTDVPAMISLFESARALEGPQPLDDLLRTACHLTVRTIQRGLADFCPFPPDEIIVSGGGTKNAWIMRTLQETLGKPLRVSDDFGVPSPAKEAIAFALLGAATLDGAPSNIPSVTGAIRAVVLGSITPRP